MTRILALVTDAFGGRGGIAQYNRDLLSAFAEAGCDVVAVPRHAPDVLQVPSGIRQRDAHAGRAMYSLAAIFETLRLRPNVVFCGHVYMAPLAWLAAKLAGAKLILQMHGIEAWERPGNLVRRVCESATLILNVSRYTRRRVLQWAALAPERAVVLPNTVGDRFLPGDASVLRREWGLDGKKVLLTVGRMASGERYKGHDRVIATMPQLMAAGHDVIYLIAGEGDDRARLERLAREAGVADRVRFVGPLSRERLVDAYRMADLFVMPSTGEGFGIAFLEAVACGTPALGLAAAGAADALADGELGTLTTEQDLGTAISTLLSRGKVEPAAISQAARDRFGRPGFAHRLRALLPALESA